MKQTKRFILSFLSLMLCTIMYAQQEIKGTVVDETGEGVTLFHYSTFHTFCSTIVALNNF